MLLRTKSPHARLDFRANALKYRNLQKLKHTLKLFWLRKPHNPQILFGMKLYKHKRLNSLLHLHTICSFQR